MSEKVKVGVVGVGALGRHHARLYNLSENADVVGIFDVNTENAQKVADEFGLKVYTDMGALAKDCEAFSVAVPATYHMQTTIPLLEMGKHVLVEKPLAATTKEGRIMLEAAKKIRLFSESDILSVSIRQWIIWSSTKAIPVLSKSTAWLSIRRRARDAPPRNRSQRCP